MKTKYLATVALALMMAAPVNAQAEGKGGVAALVNGEKVTVAEIREVWENTPQIKAQATFAEFYANAINVWVNSKVLQQAALKSGIETSKEFKEQLELARKDIAGKLYMKQLVDAKITDNDLKNFFNRYKSEFQSEKELKARHILVDSEAVANDIIAKIKAGEKFDDLAAKFSKESNHELGWFSRPMMVPEFGEAAFKMNKGQFSQRPIKTQFGYHIIIIDDTRNSKPLEFKEAEPQLRAILTQQVIGGIFKDLNDKAKIQKFGLDGKEIKE